MSGSSLEAYKAATTARFEEAKRVRESPWQHFGEWLDVVGDGEVYLYVVESAGHCWLWVG